MFVFLFVVRIQATLSLPNYTKRNSQTAACSIEADKCSFLNSAGGTRHRLNFGSKCQISLTECRIGQCYTVIDWSYFRRWGFAANVVKSAFVNFTMTNVKNLNISSGGVYFTPTDSNVNITFHVQTCDNFFKMHPFTAIEDCDADGPEISGPIRGPPMCGPDVSVYV
jgi:hypothetical protein